MKKVREFIFEELVFVGFVMASFGSWICELSIVRSIPALGWYYEMITNPISVMVNLAAVVVIGFLGEKLVKNYINK